MNTTLYEFLEFIKKPRASPAPSRNGISFIDVYDCFPVAQGSLTPIWPRNHRLEITVGSIQEAVIVKLDDQTIPACFVFGLPPISGAGSFERFSFNEHSINFYCERLPTCIYMFYHGNPYFDLLFNFIDFFRNDFQPVREGIAQTVNSLYIVGWTPNSQAINYSLLSRTFDTIILVHYQTSPNELSDMLTMVKTENLAICCNPGPSFVFPNLNLMWLEVKYEVKDVPPWFAYHHLNSIDCAVIVIWRSLLTNNDLTNLLTSWSLGRFQSLVMFSLFQIEENGDTLDYCENLIFPYPRAEGFRRPAHLMQAFSLSRVPREDEGIDIQRYDGTWGTFFVMGTEEGSTSRNFLFISWSGIDPES